MYQTFGAFEFNEFQEVYFLFTVGIAID